MLLPIYSWLELRLGVCSLDLRLGVCSLKLRLGVCSLELRLGVYSLDCWTHPLLRMAKIVKHLQHRPDRELGGRHQDQKVADAVDPLGIAEMRKWRSCLQEYSLLFDCEAL